MVRGLLSELASIDELRNQILKDIRKLELRLNASDVQIEIEKHADANQKRNFIDERTDFSLIRVKLENTILERIAVRLKNLEPELKKGIEELDQAIEDLKNTIGILEAIKGVTSIIARILVII
ncbi:hypothetical protein FD723_13415 [Nostoc sp. C052]|uniref:hypothetical protein n=1 Tax=Nostoc sp. C052 TaxID=2576902 RepID=UPI0015C326B3|nr:hypothetical protein [Nostoc sp. C052]QLE41338.1 hypothetical protein FD723_13415 [Nostoc sp. C052]